MHGLYLKRYECSTELRELRINTAWLEELTRKDLVKELAKTRLGWFEGSRPHRASWLLPSREQKFYHCHLCHHQGLTCLRYCSCSSYSYSSLRMAEWTLPSLSHISRYIFTKVSCHAHDLVLFKLILNLLIHLWSRGHEETCRSSRDENEKALVVAPL